ncbi:MAG: septum formation initiator family protein [Candidatus Electrothrix sp. AX2]|nr:septum formation initiator family protein [Candidatus Electrothrix gigas]
MHKPTKQLLTRHFFIAASEPGGAPLIFKKSHNTLQSKRTNSRTNSPKRRQSKGFSLRERRAFRRILLIVLFFGGFFLLFAPRCSLYSYYKIEKKSNRVIKENKRLLQEKAALEKEIDLLLHDKDYLEKVAREKYGMLKKNEEVYYLDPESKNK